MAAAKKYGVKLTKKQIKNLWRHFQDLRPGGLLAPHTDPELAEFEELFGIIYGQIGSEASRRGLAKKKLAEVGDSLPPAERERLELESRVKAWRTPVRPDTLYDILD